MTRVIVILATAVAVLMLLLPPWRSDAPDDRNFIGYGPLFSPPHYFVRVEDPAILGPGERIQEPGGLQRNPNTGRLRYEPGEWRETEPRLVPQWHYEQRPARLAWGRLFTQWLALGTVTWMFWALRRRPVS